MAFAFLLPSSCRMYIWFSSLDNEQPNAETCFVHSNRLRMGKPTYFVLSHQIPEHTLFVFVCLLRICNMHAPYEGNAINTSIKMAANIHPEHIWSFGTEVSFILWQHRKTTFYATKNTIYTCLNNHYTHIAYTKHTKWAKHQSVLCARRAQIQLRFDCLHKICISPKHLLRWQRRRRRRQ